MPKVAIAATKKRKTSKKEKIIFAKKAKTKRQPGIRVIPNMVGGEIRIKPDDLVIDDSMFPSSEPTYPARRKKIDKVALKKQLMIVLCHLNQYSQDALWEKQLHDKLDDLQKII